MRRLFICVAALTAFSGGAFAQTPSDPPPEAPPTETVSEPTEQPPPDAPPPADESLSRAPDDLPEIPLSRIETEDLRMLFFDPAETYLTPYVGRAFENAQDFQERLFGWEPWEQTTLLMKDFGDYGNAAARASPNNALLIDIAPLSLSYDTFSPGERFFTLTNHEVTHVALMDVERR